MSLTEPDPTRKILRGRFPPKNQHDPTALKHVELCLRKYPRPALEQLLALRIAGYMKRDRCRILLSTLAAALTRDERTIRRLLRRLDSGDAPLFATQHRYKKSSVFTLIRQPEAALKSIRHEKHCEVAENAVLVGNFSGGAHVPRKRDTNVRQKGRSRSERFIKSNESLSTAAADASREREFSHQPQKETENQERAMTGEQLVALYHEACTSRPRYDDLTPKLERAIRKQLRDYPDPEHWRQCFASVEPSDHLTARSPQAKWNGADLDWLLDPDNRRKVLAGKYVNRDDHQQQPPNRPRRIATQHDERTPDERREHAAKIENLKKQKQQRREQLEETATERYKQLTPEERTALEDRAHKTEISRHSWLKMPTDQARAGYLRRACIDVLTKELETVAGAGFHSAPLGL